VCAELRVQRNVKFLGKLLRIKRAAGKIAPPTSKVGTVRLPLLALMTISSPEGSSSIFTSRKVTPRCFRKILCASNQGTSSCCIWLSVPSLLGFLMIGCGRRREVAGSVS